MPTSIRRIYGNFDERLSTPNTRWVLVADEINKFEVTDWIPENDSHGTGGFIPIEIRNNAPLKTITWNLKDSTQKTTFETLTATAWEKVSLAISKKYSGPYGYYLEAVLSTGETANTFISGSCEKKITKAEWSKNTSSQEQSEVNYGHRLFLKMETEGCNGDKLSIEVYHSKDKEGKTILETVSTECINGNISAKLSNTLSYKSGLKEPDKKEEFYIKIKAPDNSYVSMGKKDKVKILEFEIVNKDVIPEIETNNDIAPLVVGKPEKTEFAHAEMIGDCVVQFRPNSRWKGEFGFDWFRIKDTGFDGDVLYDDIVGQYYDKAVTDVTAARNSDPNTWTRFFHRDPQPAAFSTFDRLDRLKTYYGQHKYSLEKDNAGKPKMKPYYVSYLSFLARVPDPARPGNFLEPGTAKLQLKIEFRKQGEGRRATELKPTKIVFEMDNQLMDSNHPLVSIDKHTILKDAIANNMEITVTCKTEVGFDVIKEIKVWAITEDSAGKILTKLSAGLMKMMPPSTKQTINVVIVKVKTSANTGSYQGLDEFKRNLKQALILTNIVEDDLNGDKIRIDLTDSTKNHQNIDFDTYYKVTGTNIEWDSVKDSALNRMEIHDLLKIELEKKYPGRFTNYFKLFFLNNADQSTEAGGGVAGYLCTRTDFGVMFSTHTATTIGHECLHGLGLSHTFYGNRYIYKAMATDNVVDYSHLTADKVTGASHTAITRFTTWRWQWELVKTEAEKYD